MEHKTGSRYQQIAADIASRIVNGSFFVGEKIYARSSLASYYNVSSETARRAISVLQGMHIVDATKGSGVVVTSFENAMKFVKQYDDIQTIEELKNDILAKLEKQREENNTLKEKLVELIDKTDRFNSFNPFLPYEITITKDTPHLNKTTAQINFWQNTFATIIAIKRNDSLILSPGPYAALLENDILFFIGDENSLSKVQQFLYPKNR